MKVSFKINVTASDSGELVVVAHGPSSSDIPVNVTGSVERGFVAEFIPEEEGTHHFSIQYNSIQVDGGNFTAEAYAPGKSSTTKLFREVHQS